MNTFMDAVVNQETVTENGMKARVGTGNSNTDLFFKIGASRGKNIIPEFTAAYVENPDLALRIALWARDARQGAGERALFRDILWHLDKFDPKMALKVLPKVAELGRWDDLLLPWTDLDVKAAAYDLIRVALDANNGLAAKWMPRQGPIAVELRNYFGWTPKYYRKRLVELTKVVEQDMCAGKWDDINYSHVPSVAASRYKKAFNKHSPEKFSAYVEALKSGDKSVKVNAAAVYPYDVLKGLVFESGAADYRGVELDHILMQWNALPNYVGDANILPLVDVSGSMTSKVGGYKSKSKLTCLEVAVSLGLYCADKNTGKFKDTFLTFSTEPQLVTLRGNILQKARQMVTSGWEMSTDLHKAFNEILDVAVKGAVPQEEMPTALLIMSDMQFNQCMRYNDSAMEMIERKYANAGYKVPAIVFWNLNAYENVPVKFDKSGTALISGFSPSILKSVLATDFDSMTPEGLMLKAVMVPRYDIATKT